MLLRNMAPNRGYEEGGNNGDDVNNQGQIPGDEQVGGSPEEPGLYVVLDVQPVV